ncbi:hypothetical protein COCON_G00235860 [Conger conger]|uniref:Uncharacterized protein n=1 Tax=Conger conger TaxID=82655 RepID=A0A9Q1CSP3_CONCO|nr:hypothetical protein COCON_G00235860 [Conger conger]
MMMSVFLLLLMLGLFAQESMADIVVTQSPSAQAVQQGDTVSISCTHYDEVRLSTAADAGTLCSGINGRYSFVSVSISSGLSAGSHCFYQL